MSTRRIKDAKDVSTGEKIYFTGHAKATYMSDGMNVEDAINGKQATISDLEDIRSGAQKGATAIQEEQYKGTYSKPSGGIPKLDLENTVQTSLEKADTALQSYTETDPTVPPWAKAESKPTYTASEVGAVPTTRKVNGKGLSADITLTASDVSALPNTTVIPTKVSQLTNDSNFTSNTGTITGIKMNGASKGSSGVVDLGTVITSHQDISGKADKIAISNQTASSLAISPNIFYIWGTISSLSITLASPSNSSEYNEYIFQFTSGSTATMLSVPSTVTWASEPTIEPNKTYQVSIVNNLAIIVGF